MPPFVAAAIVPWLPPLGTVPALAGLALAVMAWGLCLYRFPGQGPRRVLLARVTPPGSWEVTTAARGPEPAVLHAGWHAGNCLAALEWRLTDGRHVVTLLGPRDLSPRQWRHLRTLLRLRGECDGGAAGPLDR
jgi:hypothetical protein